MCMYIMKKNKHKYKRETHDWKSKYDHLRDNIEKYGDNYTIPVNDIDYENLNISSNINSYISVPKKYFDNTDHVHYDQIITDGYRTRQLKLLLTNRQMTIIDKWFDARVLMHNSTNTYIKSQLFIGNHIPLLNTLKKAMKTEKSKIQDNCSIECEINGKNKRITVPSHILDYVINDTLKMYTTGLTNIKRNNVKHYRVRYMKMTNPRKQIKIEPQSITEDTFYGQSLGIVKTTVNGYNYKENIKTVAILTKRKEDYYLLVKVKNEEKKTNMKDVISFDPGYKTLLTGYSNEHVIEIGKGIDKMIKRKLQIIDKIRNFESEKERKLKNLEERLKEDDINDDNKLKIVGKMWMLEDHKMTNKRKNRIIKDKYEKIRRIVNDIHKKISSYITSKFGSVIIGNLSTKRAGQMKDGDKMTKRIGNMLSFYRLKEYLKYKCNKEGVNYKETDEAFTTKCCGKCGNQWKNIKNERVYRCKNCNMKVSRDVNSSRLILISSLI